MKSLAPLWVFGEVLFDCFPDGAQVLGGAPFNVAWHLQALGHDPRFVSRVGDDEPGRKILEAMQSWGMDTRWVQVDSDHPTGRVEVALEGGQPHYTITPEVAYDFIEAGAVGTVPAGGMLYHGMLCLRHPVARAALEALVVDSGRSVFLDVNLRAPWWEREAVHARLAGTRWAKMNEDELREIGFEEPGLADAMQALQERFAVEQLVVTRGRDGASVRELDGTFYEAPADLSLPKVDTVGAGDAFSAVYLHGLIHGWPVSRILDQAQAFAGAIVGIRGATPGDRAFYGDLMP